MIQSSHSGYIFGKRKTLIQKIYAPQSSQQHCLFKIYFNEIFFESFAYLKISYQFFISQNYIEYLRNEDFSPVVLFESTYFQEVHTCIACFIVLHFIVVTRYCIFYKLRVCGNPVSSKSFSDIFPIASPHFISLCCILAILVLFKNSSLLLYFLW